MGCHQPNNRTAVEGLAAVHAHKRFRYSASRRQGSARVDIERDVTPQGKDDVINAPLGSSQRPYAQREAFAVGLPTNPPR